ncbi:CIA30 family protein [Donghicola tyrosinivorans]|uniref:Complex I intermediate-associated protein 30 (CIA30) n=1 Tax=Donghicola tyrosinivorans TaxID=1652492 RepID=A0A2T0WPP0_9RHOB|nr:CIA30 family protein [Donghicola tyrosinivorans]PRY88678.1 complex I intermediate-associated protein 30 (CIA30) [Donghicola tyrosinivorans]
MMDFEFQPTWECVTDTVMGGVSAGTVLSAEDGGQGSTRLKGRVSLANNGGFVQMATDIAEGAVFDASAYAGVAIEVQGNCENYEIRLRTLDLVRPWQSYRAAFWAGPVWTMIELPFTVFAPNKTEVPFTPARLRRLGVVAYGRAFEADVSVRRIGFYR